jgi:hypothetical protein
LERRSSTRPDRIRFETAQSSSSGALIFAPTVFGLFKNFDHRLVAALKRDWFMDKPGSSHGRQSINLSGYLALKTIDFICFFKHYYLTKTTYL